MIYIFAGQFIWSSWLLESCSGVSPLSIGWKRERNRLHPPRNVSNTCTFKVCYFPFAAELLIFKEGWSSENKESLKNAKLADKINYKKILCVFIC